MHQKLTRNPAYAKRISKIRSRTVEPVLGTLVNFLNMRRINSRGMAQANKHSLSREYRDDDGCAYLQPEKVSKLPPEGKSNPEYSP